MPIASSLKQVAIDCADPHALADFYRRLVGGEIDLSRSDETWVHLTVPDGTDLGFQTAPDVVVGTWPAGDSQLVHLDFAVDDLDAGEAAALAIGATKAEVQPMPSQWRVLIDPAGYPFCLVPA